YPASPQQRLVLRPDGSAFQPGVPDPNAPTNIISPRAHTPVSSVNSDIRTPYHGFAQPGGIGYQPAPGQFGGARPLPAQRPPQRGQRRVVALLGILLVLLLLLGATVMFAVRPALLNGVLGNNAAPIATSTVSS